MTHVTVVVVHFNNRKLTLSCLDSLDQVKTQGFRLTVLVVDNGSTKIFSLPKHLRGKRRFVVIRSDANLGFTGGNNLGIHYAIEHFNSQYLCMLNNDTVVDRFFLAELLRTAQSTDTTGIVAPKIYFSSGKEYHRHSYRADQRGKVLWFAGGSIDWRNLYAFHRGVDEVDRGQFDTVQPIDFASGCCALIKRDVLEKIGLLDKRYFMYLEDVDYSLRAKEAGFTVMYCPAAVVWHDNAGSSGGAGSQLHLYYQERNRTLLAFLHGSWKDKLTALRLQAMNSLSGDTVRRRAVIDFYLKRFGKQALV